MLISVLLMGLTAAPAAAETLVAGARHEGPKSLEVSAFGVAFDLPAGWTAAQPAGSEWIHVGKDNQVGRVFVWLARASDEDVRAAMTQGFTAADAVMLTPTGPIKTEGGAMAGDYSATDGSSTFQAHVRAQRSGGVTVAVVAVAPPEAFAEFKSLALGLAKSVKFGVAAKSAPAGSSSPWATTLAGQRVSKYHTKSGASGGYSEKTQFDLCANGQFFKNFRASSVSGWGDGVSSNRDGGTWSVQGNQLVLRWSSGEVSQHVLEDRGGQLFVDGERWLLAGQATCQ